MCVLPVPELPTAMMFSRRITYSELASSSTRILFISRLMKSFAESTRSGRSGLAWATVTPALTSRCAKRSSAVRTEAAVGSDG